ncbi:MAG: hypothetical protein OJF49_000791 [Ktedonobacterales bacterium]|nr:MAG: hypothetical protein OJF49_000791 [Ktedonobacterales bacterium]
MNSYTTDRFWDLFRALSVDIRKQAQQAYQQFARDPFHPGLNFEEVDKQRQLWSARVTRGYRVLGYREGNEITWFWIGPHREYEKLIKGR